MMQKNKIKIEFHQDYLDTNMSGHIINLESKIIIKIYKKNTKLFSKIIEIVSPSISVVKSSGSW